MDDKSGKNTTGRPEFTEMIRLIGNGNPDDVRYVLVFKLSRFGRNAADVLSNLQLMQDNGVNLICVEDGIDSASPAGKILFPVLAGVAELERENIQAQTKAGRQKKAREGKWNGGQAPLGYRIVRDESGKNGQLVIDEEEAKLVRLIFDKYVHSNLGYSGVAKWLNDNGYRRSLRQNRKYALFADFSVKCILETRSMRAKSRMAVLAWRRSRASATSSAASSMTSTRNTRAGTRPSSPRSSGWRPRRSGWRREGSRWTITVPSTYICFPA